MSTFDGFVSEFPLIRIDRFVTLPDKPPPLACFLSHVHSDHLVGLESFKSPFIYCSSATREILLRLEKYPHRMNFAKGILECRSQTYKHLSKLLKPLPLETPTRIELGVGNDIQVTLFDANHCIGSVMFLVEGQNKAILYTGDVRAEKWWVNSLVRNPILVPYRRSGHLRLNNIYLDTTFATDSEAYRAFPSKASGINELLQKVKQYPKGTTFYFKSWTFGYEEVWQALSHMLGSQIHLDAYRYGLYKSLAGAPEQGGPTCRESPTLTGFKLGNSDHPGILTRDPTVNIHSCEEGSPCCVFLEKTATVTILPILARQHGVEIAEMGVGGGVGDLNQSHELDVSDRGSVQRLLQLCASSGHKTAFNTGELAELVRGLAVAKESVSLDDVAPLLAQLKVTEETKTGVEDINPDDIPIHEIPKVLAKLVRMRSESSKAARNYANPKAAEKHEIATYGHPTTITFPYSRHSSYSELRSLVFAFRPYDVWPCAASPTGSWTQSLSMKALFGDVCAYPEGTFAHDVSMQPFAEARQDMESKRKWDTFRKRHRDVVERGLARPSGSLRAEPDTSGSEEHPAFHRGRELLNRRIADRAARKNQWRGLPSMIDDDMDMEL